MVEEEKATRPKSKMELNEPEAEAGDEAGSAKDQEQSDYKIAIILHLHISSFFPIFEISCLFLI